MAWGQVLVQGSSLWALELMVPIFSLEFFLLVEVQVLEEDLLLLAYY